ncbi:MAG: GNAT family N-acetyltransferase [Thermoplasmata archaeon]|nr:GNAT family N-acetyltransferase [Thermoplasmata archaeon]
MEAAFEIRRLRPGEESEIVRAAELQDELPDPEAARAYLSDSRNVFLLAYHGGRAVGYLRGTSLGQVKSTQAQMFLYEIAVATKFRRRGVGTRLVHELLRYCRKVGCEEVFVFTDPGNTAAVRLFTSTGGVTETPADRMFVYRL